MPASIDPGAFMRDEIERLSDATLNGLHLKVFTTAALRAISNCSGCLVDDFGFAS
jgi:hypothetical protein